MTSRKITIGLAGWIGLMLHTAAAEGPPDFTKVDAAIEADVESLKLPGASILVEKDGAVVYERYFGAYKKETVVPIASASKWLSAAAILTLVDEGKIGLDDPVSKYLPKFTGKAGVMTLRQLLSHTSGLPGQGALLMDRSISLEEAVDRIAGMELVADPGAEFRYGGISFQVAGRMAEVVSGRSWAAFFRERITGPLRMTSTRFAPRNPHLAGGAVSSLHDYANFLRMILADGEFEGKRILSKATVREMQQDQTRGAKLVGASQIRRRLRSQYGLGEWRDVVDADGTAVEVSSPGAFGFRPWIDHEHNLLGVFLVEIRNRPAAGAGVGPGAGLGARLAARKKQATEQAEADAPPAAAGPLANSSAPMQVQRLVREAVAARP